jgi:hypothetical protein
MSVTESPTRPAAGGGQGAAPVSPPRVVGQRRVRRGWVAAGVLFIVLSALGSVTLFRALGPSEEYLAVATDVPAGAQVTPADLMVVRLHHTPGLSVVPMREAGEVVGKYAAVPLAAGTLVSPAQLTDRLAPGPGEQLVAISWSRNELPGGTLRGGDRVLLVATGGQAASSGPTAEPPTFDAVVHLVQPAEGRGNNVVVSLLVADRDGPAVATLAANDRVSVVKVAEPAR